MTSDCVVFGCRTAYAAEVAEVAQRAGRVIVAMIDNIDGEPMTSAYGPVVKSSDIAIDLLECDVLIPMLTPGYRNAAQSEARSLGFRTFPTVIDPSSIVATTAALGAGTLVNAGVVIGAHSQLGRFVHVNRSASIAHDATVADYVSIGPGATLSGGVRLGSGAFIGAAAVFAPNVSVGTNSIVGAGAVVVRDVPPNVIVAGNPAKTLRAGIAGYGDVAVG